jgi:hypothetical protein
MSHAVLKGRPLVWKFFSPKDLIATAHGQGVRFNKNRGSKYSYFFYYPVAKDDHAYPV